jgi:hypothetical protein
MSLKRDIVVFFAGAEAFHTLSHIIMAFAFQFPVQMKWMAFTTTMNVFAILINAAITVALLWWAKRLNTWW